MMKWRLFVGALLFAGIFCLAQQGRVSANWQSRDSNYDTSGSAYVGPGDVIASAKAWFGVRAYSSADRGNKLINICDAAGANCIDWVSSSTTGKLVNQTVGSTDCTSVNTCQIKTLYDRSGSLACGSAACDVTQSTAADRPTLTWSCLNGLPCLVFSGTTILLTNSTGFTQAQTFTISTMFNRTSGTGPCISLTSATNGDFFGCRNTAANTVQIYATTAGVTLGNITDANWHSFQAVFAGSGSFIVCGGSAGTSCSAAGTKSASLSPGSGSMAGALTVGGPSGSAVSFDLTEAGLWAGTFSTSVYNNMTANQAAFYGSY